MSNDGKKIVIVCAMPTVMEEIRFSKYLGERTFKVLPSVDSVIKRHNDMMRRKLQINKSEYFNENGIEVYYLEYK